MQNKTPYNAQGQRHGLWEQYHTNGQLSYKGTYINDMEHGPWVTYYDSGQLWVKGTYNMGQRDGIFEWYNLNGSIKETRFYAR
jgi:antitoxin component YwqK of YwqJK toxin-antitoxin module